MTHPYDEDRGVEQPAMALLADLGWDTANGFDEGYAPTAVSGRNDLGEVVLTSRLRPALERLNPGMPPEAIALAIEALTADRRAMSQARANQDVYRLLKDGARVAVPDDEGAETIETVRLIDWDDPRANDFFAVRQLWVTGDMYKRRTDIVGFVNGIPLVLIELKASHKVLERGYRDNICDYKDTIPQLFWYNGLILVSNGSEARVGSLTAAWEHYAEWKRINSEGETGIISLDTVLRATCEPARLLDVVENFSVFQEVRGGLVKLVAKNHQYLGVNNAISALREIEGSAGRLGVFWHTQGSGKSISMVFFAQKVLRRLPGNWTFVVVTDRRDLDDQIYKVFQDTGAVTEGHVQAESGEHLRQLLTEDHRYVFTLIHKFRTAGGETYPALTDRSDIIVMTDEAHRTQYDVLALNMRNALPNASFIGFTGTPLIAGEEKTREVFGDYVSVYDFKASIEDGATVPLYYENRIPELQLVNEDFNEDMERLLESAELDEGQERLLARQFSREYHLITREERLEQVAADLVDHFMGRGYAGKAMVVSIDKATAVRMYDKVQANWRARIKGLGYELDGADAPEAALLRAEIEYMAATDMAVVVSPAQNEIADMRAKGLDIRPHRERMVNEDLEAKFKDPDDPFRIVFVCAMWMTGFDVPTCSTIYLDKPMRNHTLMQAIARANRVWRDKTSGLIVDYVGVFRSLQRALAIYGSGAGGIAGEGETPVLPKEELVAALRARIDETVEFCRGNGISVADLLAERDFSYINMRDDAVDLLLITPDTKARYLHLADQVNRLFKAVLPDPAANEFGPYRALFVNLAEKIRSTIPPADIGAVMGGVEALLDDSVAARAYVIRAAEEEGEYRLVNLSEIDFDALQQRFETGRKRTEAEKLKGAIGRELTRMVRLNPTRRDYMERFQRLIDEYNAGSKNVDEFFHQLVEFTQSLTAEQQRTAAEELSDEELAVFDLLTRNGVSLTDKERREVKKIARQLLDKLKRDKLVIDWRKRQQTRAAVRLVVEQELDHLPATFESEAWQAKADRVYQHIYDSYFGDGRSVYENVA